MLLPPPPPRAPPHAPPCALSRATPERRRAPLGVAGARGVAAGRPQLSPRGVAHTLLASRYPVGTLPRGLPSHEGAVHQAQAPANHAAAASQRRKGQASPECADTTGGPRLRFRLMGTATATLRRPLRLWKKSYVRGSPASGYAHAAQQQRTASRMYYSRTRRDARRILAALRPLPYGPIDGVVK